MQRAPARLASRAPGFSIARQAAPAADDPAPAGPDATDPEHPSAERRAASNAARGESESESTSISACDEVRQRWTPTPRLRTIDSSCHVPFRAHCDRRRRWSPSSSLAAPIAIGCATSDEESKPVTYSLTAKQNYEKGLAELKDENFPEAQKYFQFVKQKYPFSKFAVLAELGIADTQFARGNYTEAIDSYKSFARLHPTHEKVEDGYVAFRICESYFKDMPEDVWLLPPSYEKDQSAIIDAQREIDDFRKKFPTSPYMKKADEHPPARC